MTWSEVPFYTNTLSESPLALLIRGEQRGSQDLIWPRRRGGTAQCAQQLCQRGPPPMFNPERVIGQDILCFDVFVLWTQTLNHYLMLTMLNELKHPLLSFDTLVPL